MGHWDGETTLVHVDTMAVTTSPVQAGMFYPGFHGDGVDDPRFSLEATLADRSIRGTGAPDTDWGTRAWTGIDGGAYAGVVVMTHTGLSTMALEISWRPLTADGGFAQFDPSLPVVYSERGALRRLRDY